MTRLKDLFPLRLTEEEYQEILRYVDVNLPWDWMLKHDSGELKIPRNELNPNAKGILGECALAKHEGKSVSQTLAERPIRESDAGWDIVIGELKYDIKTLQTIRRPNLKFRFNIKKSTIDKNKENDGYIWISMVIYVGLTVPFYWLVAGWMLKDEFLRKAILHKAGELSMTGNKFVYEVATYDISLRKLHPFKEIPR
ncbi:MAG: hypothetical protein KAX31_01780 [Thermoplasmata archaeon]|nr:hypothetical protein [Thermoplasmata archaeon]